MRNSKKGVSLITVLLFMLVATIAATATFKWLGSENRSSASRMLQNEARQSAIAGIEAARSWMTYHGNDVGAIVKQFYANGKKPISLSKVISSRKSEDENYEVALVAIDQVSNQYKMKVVSTGVARNSTTYSEAAILKVSGLYRVKTPQKKASVDFSYSYFGSSITYEGTNHMTSIVVNGNWDKNPPETDGDFIITGNATLSGNELNSHGTSCIGGNLNADNGIKSNSLYVKGKTSGTALEVHVGGDAYFEGNLNQGSQPIEFQNLTVGSKSKITTNSGSNKFVVGGNLCIEEGGQIDMPNDNTSEGREFHVSNNVWIPGKNAIYKGYDNNYQSILLGGSKESNVYIADARSFKDYEALYNAKQFIERGTYKRDDITYWGNKDGTEALKSPNASISHTYVPYYKTNQYTNLMAGGISDNEKYFFYHLDPGKVDVDFREHNVADIGNVWGYYIGDKYYRELPGASTSTFNYSGGKILGSPYCKNKSNNHPECGVNPWFRSLGKVSSTMPAEKPFTCGENAKAHCDSIWIESPGCDGAKYLVPDPLITAYSKFSGYANNLACSKELTRFADNDGDEVINKLNECYNNTKANPDSASKLYNDFLVVKFSGNQNASPKKPLEGKFIFIYEENAGDKLRLPPSNDVAFVYLANGAGDIMAGTCDGRNQYNYFVYTSKNIKLLMNWKENGCQINGSVYGRVQDDAGNNVCAKVESANGNDGLFLKYNQEVVDKLTDAAILCEASVGVCGGASSGPSSTTVVEDDVDASGYDSHYIAMGAQLNIEMESEYKSTEKNLLKETEEITPSIVVLPRIVYLTTDADGALRDYFNVQALNGAKINKNGTSSCEGAAPPTIGTMRTGADTLKAGFYKCTYTEGSYSSGYYVSVVPGSLSTMPIVSFAGSTDNQINPGESYSSEVVLDISGVSKPTSTTFTIDIVVTNAHMSGWTITPQPNVTKRTSSSGDDVYTYEGTVSSTKQSIPIFNLATVKGANSGSVTMMLLTPLDCMIGNPSAKSFNIKGSASIKRHSIKEYCTTYPANCTGDNQNYADAGDADDCVESGMWVSIDGPGCSVKSFSTINNEWVCNAGNGFESPIKLMSMYTGDYCDILIPTENNSIVGAKDDDDNPDKPYKLYASLKKKRFKLHIDIKGADKGAVRVSIKKNESDHFTEYATCNNRSEGCDYNLDANTYVKTEVIPNGDRFSYWNCFGTKCKQPTFEATELEFVMDGNLTYEARFNERDDHCFYTSFDTTSSFCTGTTLDDCIDRCATSNSCKYGEGQFGNDARWLMLFSNNGSSWSGLTKGYDGIRYDGGKYRDTKAQHQSLVLSRVIAGSNGTMTARIKTANEVPSLSTIRNKNNLNSGFILRSNADASSYIILNLYGAGFDFYARICYASGQFTANNDKCVEKKVKSTSGATSPNTNTNTIIDVNINLQNEILRVDFNFETEALSWYNASAEFNLNKDWTYGTLLDAEHQYVGFKATDDDFKIKDLGWRAKDFTNTACFDYPTLDCSFAMNYMGGIVPLNTIVQPWIGFSSWYSDKASCMANLKFYYNGCDVPNSYYNLGLSALIASRTVCPEGISSYGYFDNLYGDDGLKMKTKDYYFKYQGEHGFNYSEGKRKGIVRNASVVVDCEGKAYTANCGRFYVGELNECSKNYQLSGYIEHAGVKPITIVLDEVVNLRKSKLNFSLNMYDIDKTIDVILEDEKGSQSSIQTISAHMSSFEVDNISDKVGFNPEKVTKIILQGTTVYKINSIESVCPNAVSISGCTVNYNGDWVINSSLTHPENAKKCKITAVGSDIPDMPSDFVPCGSGTFTISDPGFYQRLNDGYESSKMYTFKVEVFDKEDALFTDESIIKCEAISPNMNKAKATCIISETEVFEGAGVPKFNYDIANCKDCYFEISLLGHASTGNLKYPQASNLYKPDINAVGAILTHGDYTYRLTVNNSEGTPYNGVNKCEKTFRVKEVKEASASCSISGDFLLVEWEGANNEVVPITLVYTDHVGNILGMDNIGIGDKGNRTIDLTKQGLTVGSTYTFTLSLKGNSQDCGMYTFNLVSSSSSSAISSAVVSSSSIGGALVHVTKVTQVEYLQIQEVHVNLMAENAINVILIEVMIVQIAGFGLVVI